MDFTFTQRLPVAREPLFQFHEDPENLRVLLEGWEVTTVLTTDGHIRPGARTGVLERMGPFRMRFVFEHFLLEPPERFGERQVRGIFRFFEHVHEFEEAETGATVIRDRLKVQLPVWLGGEAATRLVVAPRLVRFFSFRRRAYERLVAEGRIGGC